MASLLPLPDDPRGQVYQRLIAAWPDKPNGVPWVNRAEWLSAFEYELRLDVPAASSRDRKLTARHYAPFYLRDGYDVP